MSRFVDFFTTFCYFFIQMEHQHVEKLDTQKQNHQKINKLIIKIFKLFLEAERETFHARALYVTTATR